MALQIGRSAHRPAAWFCRFGGFGGFGGLGTFGVGSDLIGGLKGSGKGTTALGSLLGTRAVKSKADFTRTFGGGRQHGGLASAGRAVLVGETGPEIFSPGSTGFVTPISKFGRGGGQQINVNITFAPLISLADQAEVEGRLMPLIVQGLRQARLEGKA